MTDKETEQWLYEAYKYTRDFDFRRLDEYKKVNDDLCISDLILDYTMLYEHYQEETKRLNNTINELEEWLEIEERKCKNYATNDYEGGYVDAINTIIVKLKELKKENK